MALIAKAITAYQSAESKRNHRRKLDTYLQGGRIPWSQGYNEYKWQQIKAALNNADLLRLVSSPSAKLPDGFGLGLDERIVEYPWIFSRLSPRPTRLLDAGSTFNFESILDANPIPSKELTIFTLAPERHSYPLRGISYVFGDLRRSPFRDGWFDEIVCQSTIEHVGMDNAIYGAFSETTETNDANREYLGAVNELVRVLKRGGRLLLTFPCGKFEQHGFFQQFDADMIRTVLDTLEFHGKATTNYVLYTSFGWTFASVEACAQAESHNPRTGKGKGSDGAAHSRAICCIDFIKADL